MAALALGGLAFWRLTALPVAETYPREGEADVPTNAAIHVKLQTGERNWGPGIQATYETGEYVPGTSGGAAQGGVWFMPDGGWRRGARVRVRVCCGPYTRAYYFSFTTASGPSEAVTPPSEPAPRPTALPTGVP